MSKWLSRAKVLAGVVYVAGSVLLTTGCESVSSSDKEVCMNKWSENPVRFVAHRGESYYAPENTVEAYELAWNVGACWGVEVDVHLTKDGVLIANHDYTTERTSGVSGVISEMTYEELSKLDVGSWKSPMWAGTRIPTLRDVLATLPKEGHIFVEIKRAGEGFNKAYEEARLGSGVTHDQVSFISFSLNELINVRKMLPDSRTLYLIVIKQDENGVITPTAADMIKVLKDNGLTGLDCMPDTLKVDDSRYIENIRKYIAEIHEAGLEFHTWTFNDFERAKILYELGVNSITTDCSGILKSKLTEYYEQQALECGK